MGKESFWPIRTAKVRASLRICAVSPEPMLFAHESGRPGGNFSEICGLAKQLGMGTKILIRQKIRREFSRDVAQTVKTGTMGGKTTSNP